MGGFCIGLVINQIEGSYQSRIYRGLADWAEDHGHRLVLLVGRSLGSPYVQEEPHNGIYALGASEGIDGLVVCTGSVGNFLGPGGMAAYLESFGPRPLVTIGLRIPGHPGLGTDNAQGMADILDHLVVEHRHRRIAYLGGPAHNPDARERREAFVAALRSHGLEAPPSLLYEGDFTYRSAQRIAESLAPDQELPFDALVVANDDMAMGFVHTMEKKGFLVPRDYAITGFDDVPFAEFLSPPLTTVHQALYEQGYRAGEALLERLEGGASAAEVRIPGRLTVRESCGCSSDSLVRFRVPGARDAKAGEGPGPGATPSKKALVEGVVRHLALPRARMDQLTDAVGALFDSFTLDVRVFRDRSLFLMALSEWLDIAADWHDFREIWYRILGGLHQAFLASLQDQRSLMYLELTFNKAYEALTRKAGVQSEREAAHLRHVMGVFREYAWRVETVEDLPAVLDLVGRLAHLVEIGPLALCLHADGPQPIHEGPGLPTYGDMRVHRMGVKATRGEGGDLVQGFDPRQEASVPDHRCQVLMPLLSSSHSYGYVVFGSRRGQELMVWESMRNVVSQCLAAMDQKARIRDAEGRLTTAMDQLRRGEELYREMLRVVPMMVIETDMNLGITYINQAGIDGLGPMDSDSDRRLRSYIPEADRHGIQALVFALEKAPVVDYPRIRLLDRRHRRYLPLVQVMGIYGGGGRLTGLRWNALSPLPLIAGSVLPDRIFFLERNITDREQEVIEGVVQGLPLREIADRLFIAESTVKGHLTKIYDKLGISSRSELVHLLQEVQVRKHGFNAYLFSLVSQLLSAGEEGS